MEAYKMNISDKYLKIIEEVTKFMEPHPVYVTGGFVRDSLLGIEPKVPMPDTRISSVLVETRSKLIRIGTLYYSPLVTPRKELIFKIVLLYNHF